MSFVKRIAATVTASFDQAISQIENHDAVIEVALHETQDATARLKVQLARRRGEIQQFRDEIAQLQVDAGKWTERARRTATEDEKRALECLRRRNECRERTDAVERRLRSGLELAHRLEGDLKRLSGRMEEIKQRRRELRSRELSARGARAIADLERDSSLDVERIFERWEVEVTRTELSGEMPVTRVDTLADDFELDELDLELKAELQQLRNDEENAR